MQIFAKAFALKQQFMVVPVFSVQKKKRKSVQQQRWTRTPDGYERPGLWYGMVLYLTGNLYKEEKKTSGDKDW